MPPKLTKDADQPAISSFFKKAPAPPKQSSSAIDLTSSPPRKRIKLSDATAATAPNTGAENNSSNTSPPTAEASSSSKNNASKVVTIIGNGAESTNGGASYMDKAEAARRRKEAMAGAFPSRVALSKFKAPEIVKDVEKNGNGDGMEVDAVENGEDEDIVAPTQTQPEASSSRSQPQPQPQTKPNSKRKRSPSPKTSTLTLDERLKKDRHEKWQKRLGEGLILGRRKSLDLERGEEEAGAEDDMDGEGDGEGVIDVDEVVAPKGKGKGKAKAAGKGKGKKAQEEVGPSGQTYTPLEKQFMEIKEKNKDVLLFMEVGYKFKFHGDDARIASKELGIACFPNRNFMSASIPVHRLQIHVKKLIARGHKVGVVRQMETAALKAAGDNRNKPFERKMTHLYTASTYVDDSSLIDDDLLTESNATNAFVCINESPGGGNGSDDRVTISIIGIIISTGDVVYDEFGDTHLRNELETRLMHLAPTEILLPEGGLSASTEKVIRQWIDRSQSNSTSGTRLERRKFVKSVDKSIKDILAMCKTVGKERKLPTNEVIDISDDDEVMEEVGEDLMDERAKILNGLSKGVVSCVAAAIKHLERFSLEDALLHLETFKPFSTRSTMLLSANTLMNLEIYRNQTDGSSHGSLLWLLDQTKTKMGKRLLREWIGKPLVDIDMLEERLDAITEIKENASDLTLEKMRGLLKGAIPDLSRGLSRIAYGRATPGEVATILIAIQRLSAEFDADISTGRPANPLLNRIVSSLPVLREPVATLLDDIDVRKARTDKPEDMFKDPTKFPDIQEAKELIAEAEEALDEHLKDVRKELKMGALQYSTVAGIEYLIEVKAKHPVPDDWVKISATKYFSRYHTPFVITHLKELEQGKETLIAAGKSAFLAWQAEITEHYDLFREATMSFATFDCLTSLAKVAIGSGSEYSRPEFVKEGRVLKLEGVRHPMSEALIENYVDNDIAFSDDTTRLAIILGPNMGDKSSKTSFTRAVALNLILAQIGSYVPCTKAELSVHDAVWTRMGASDDLARNRSTFMVELKETSDILAGATERSFVILDELGRGTSTIDGTAIAWAVLDDLVEKKCNTLFTTHFPSLSRIQDTYPNQISIHHMGFQEIQGKDGYPEIIFLYKLFPSLSTRSFGTYVGRLAGLPRELLEKADDQAEWMRQKVRGEWVRKLGERLGKSLEKEAEGEEGNGEGRKVLDLLKDAGDMLEIAED